MKLLLKYFLLLCFLIASSCSGRKDNAQPNSFFSLKSYFNQQIDALQKSGADIIKKTSVDNEATEEYRIVDADWRREFDSFIAADISGEEFTNAYRIDTADEKTDSIHIAKTIRYTAIDNEQRIRLIVVQLDSADHISRIEIEAYKKSVFSIVTESLVYVPMKYFTITNYEDSGWLGKNELKVAGIIVIKS